MHNKVGAMHLPINIGWALTMVATMAVAMVAKIVSICKRP
jgi:hypothetical protein